jgi:hypothetical protein
MFIDSPVKTLISEELSGDKIHDLTNIITLEAAVHEMFDHLRVWLLPFNVRILVRWLFLFMLITTCL